MVSNQSNSTSPSSLRRMHRGLVMSLIQSEPGISRSQISRRLGFSEMAATRIIRELLEAGIVAEIGETPTIEQRAGKRLGRPRIGLRILEDGLFAAGITVSAYHSEVSICDANGELRARKQVKFFISPDIGETAKYYGRELQKLIEESRVDPARIVGVGVALAARTASSNGSIVKSDYLGWDDDSGVFCATIEDATGLPVEIDNITNALAIGEMRFGAAQSLTDFVLIHVATLIGASVMSGGRLVRGKEGVSGVIGHIRAEPVEQRCVCGRSDCLNLTATGFGILARTGKLSSPNFERKYLEEYAADLLEVIEDPGAQALIETTGAKFAPALDGICKLLGPEKVIVTGHLGGTDHYIEGLRTAMKERTEGYWPAGSPIVPGAVSPNQAAALLALSSFCYSPLLDFDRFSGDAVHATAIGKG